MMVVLLGSKQRLVTLLEPGLPTAAHAAVQAWIPDWILGSGLLSAARAGLSAAATIGLDAVFFGAGTLNLLHDPQHVAGLPLGHWWRRIRMGFISGIRIRIIIRIRLGTMHAWRQHSNHGSQQGHLARLGHGAPLFSLPGRSPPAHSTRESAHGACSSRILAAKHTGKL